jgi:hypothetical protein
MFSCVIGHHHWLSSLQILSLFLPPTFENQKCLCVTDEETSLNWFNVFTQVEWHLLQMPQRSEPRLVHPTTECLLGVGTEPRAGEKY